MNDDNQKEADENSEMQNFIPVFLDEINSIKTPDPEASSSPVLKLRLVPVPGEIKALAVSRYRQPQ